jgi:hypothetical protein
VTRWANETFYDDSVLVPKAQVYRVPLALLKGLIAHESQFNERAYRFEPGNPDTASDDDASRGLMQILFRTAQGEGYTGDPDGLFDPATNVEYGLRYLRRQLDRANGDVRGALSAYNGGWNPKIGFGAPATKPGRVCLRRAATGECEDWHEVPVGQFANQGYVDAVISNVQYFAQLHAQSLADVQAELTAGQGTGFSSIAAALAIILGALLALFLGGRR